MPTNLNQKLTLTNGCYGPKRSTMALPASAWRGWSQGPEAEAVANRFIEGELTHEQYHAEMRRLALDIARNGQ